MKRVIISRFLPLVVAMLLGVVSSWAQVSFNVKAPSPVEKGERFLVEFIVDAEPDHGTFKSPSFEGFEVLAGPATSIGQSVQFINGTQTSSYTCTYTYTLKAVESGKFIIDRASIAVDGKAYSTKPLSVEVIDGVVEEAGTSGDATNNVDAASSRRDGNGVLLRWVLSDSEVYKGETVRASLVLYFYDNVDNIVDFDMGPFENFWSQDLKIEPTVSRANYNGRVYNTYKLNEYLLSPQGVGELSLPEASLKAIVLVPIASNSYDIFFGSRYDRDVRTVKAPATVVNVKEFPSGAPQSFKGAVGDFSLSYDLPEGDINVNSADEVSVTISGDGNLNFITAPEFTLPKSFELYDTKVEEKIQNMNNGVRGSITYRYPFVARATGDFDIPAIEFSYFDPSTERYETLTTEPIKLTIIDDGSVATSSTGGVNTVGYGSSSQLEKDIYYISTDKLTPWERSPLLFSDIYWIVVVISIIIFIAIFVIMRQRIRANNNIISRRMKRADKVAIQRLRLANKFMKEGNRHAFYEEILRAMWGYIGDKFNIPVADLTKETIREELTQRRVSVVDAEHFCGIISRADEAQYAPTTDGDMSGVYIDAVETISKIESVLKH